MMMFWMMQSNGAQGPSLAVQAETGDTTAAGAYANARAGLLRREARREGIARWLGIGNQTGEWLNSTYFPDIANGTAPPSGSNDTAHEAYRIENYAPQSDGELTPVPPLVRDTFVAATPKDEGDYRLYQQNLTGFAKGLWYTRRFSFEELGLTETWQEARLVASKSEKEGAAAGNETVAADSANRLRRRQNDPASTNLTTVTETFNRTALRGSFPWLSSLSANPSTLRKTHPAMFNLRSLQTSATGPILPLPSDATLLDEGELLRMRHDDPATWEEWEKEGPAVYVGGQLLLNVKDAHGADEEESIELDIEAIQYVPARPHHYASCSLGATAASFRADACTATRRLRSSARTWSTRSRFRSCRRHRPRRTAQRMPSATRCSKSTPDASPKA